MSSQIYYIYNNKPNIFPYEKTVLELFQEKINNAIEKNKKLSIYCAVGFFFFEGLSELIPDLEKLYNKGLLKEFKLVMGRETKATTKEVLEAIKNDATYLSNKDYLFIKKLYDEGIFDFRIYLDRRFHIKLYLFEENDVLTDVWAGSANLTSGGLKDNIELIVPTGVTSKDREIYKEFFNKIWESATDKVEELKTIDLIKKGATAKAIYLPPREFFANLIKILEKEYLLSNPSVEISYLAEFQHMSYFMCLEKLNKWGGVILANSVGLGKTDVACAIAKYYTNMGKKVLVIHPPNVEHQWMNTLKKVGLSPCKGKTQILDKWVEENNQSDNYVVLLSMGLLQNKNFNVQEYDGFDLIIVDEAHNFRNLKSNRRKNLNNLIMTNQNCHTLLITATPINISLADYISLLELFTLKEKYKERFESEGIINKIETINKLIRNDDTVEAVKIIRELIKEFTVRLEWIDILKHFKKDLERIAGVTDFKMPTVIPVEYKYDDRVVQAIFNRVVDYLAQLNYEYAKLWDEEGYKEDKNLIFWYKWRLYKRLESSVYAFKKSLEKFKERNEYLLNIFNKIDNKEKISNDLLSTPLFDKERLKIIISTYKSLKEVDRNKIKENIEKDIILTTEMLDKIKSIEKILEIDEKVKKLIEILKKENKPTIIFSESRDTVMYLKEKLEKEGFTKVGVAYGGDVQKKGVNKKKVQDEFNSGVYDILVTTDVLSEGVNLPRADVVINFDLPYNPVKLIQRAGRAIRLNNPKHIKIYNFKPDESIDMELELCNKLKIRVENIVATIGIEFIIWSIDQKKIEEFSDKNRKRIEEAIKEWKQKLSSSNPEELSKIVESSLDKIDKVLKDYINHYLISEETVEEHYHRYEKPIYTSLVGEKDGYFVVFKYRANHYYCGELEFTTNDTKLNLDDYDFKMIDSMINNKINKLDEEFLKSKLNIDRLSNKIKKLVKKCDSTVERLINSTNIETLPTHKKEKLINLLEEYLKIPPFISEAKSDIIKKIEDLIKNSKNIKQTTLDRNIDNKFRIIAIIKYFKEKENEYD
ncbi:helicase-related protein (plasmid) [Methanocaldococcus indicus]